MDPVGRGVAVEVGLGWPTGTQLLDEDRSLVGCSGMVWTGTVSGCYGGEIIDGAGMSRSHCCGSLQLYYPLLRSNVAPM